MKMSKSAGFTLVEVMIVVAIVGIIASIAYPNYRGMLATSARSAAQADLMAFASAMERHSASHFTYEGAGVGGNDTGTPAIFAGHSPATEPVSEKKYDLTIQAVSANGLSYEIKAVPVKGSVVANDGELIFYSDGRKAWDKNGNGAIGTDEFCWSC